MIVSSDSKLRYRVRGAPIIHDTIDNETIAINQLTGAYYSIEGPGALAWSMLGDGATAHEIADRLAHEYAADRGTIDAAVEAFLEEMTREELIVAADFGELAGNGQAADEQAADEQAAPEPDRSVAPSPFTGLRLQRYNDLEVMLLADPIHEVDETGWPMPLTDSRE